MKKVKFLFVLIVLSNFIMLQSCIEADDELLDNQEFQQTEQNERGEINEEP